MSQPKKPRRPNDPLAPYRRIRKPMPPPGRIISDRRREIARREAERETRDPEPDGA